MTNEEKKAKLIEVLESGEFEQGKYELAGLMNDDRKLWKYCCIGVFGVVCLGIKPEKMRGYDGDTTYEEFRNLFGSDKADRAIEMNDDNGYNFKQIAGEFRNWPVLPDSPSEG